jgi:hypothetical protein
MEFLSGEVLKGVGLLLGGIGAGAAYVKKWPSLRQLKRIEEKEHQCTDAACHEKVITTIAKVVNLEKGQAEIFQKLDDMPERIVTLLKDTKGLLG